MPLAVIIQPRATQEIEEIDGWWRKHRPSAPDLFMTELERAFAIAALMPSLGAIARSERLPEVRRILLTRTRYHLYYRVREDALDVLAVWHAARRTGPGL